MEKAVHLVRREEEQCNQLQNRARSQATPLAGKVAFQVESGEKYVGIHLQRHGIFLNVLFKHTL